MNTSTKYTFDLECTTSESEHVCWLAACTHMESEYTETFFNIEQLINYIFTREDGSVFYAHNLKYDFSFIYCHLAKHHAGEFECTSLIVNEVSKSIFTVKVTFRGVTTRFVDSFPLFSTSLDNVLKSFTDLQKGETPVYRTLSDVVITEKEIDYVRTDAIGLARALKNRLHWGAGRLTTASDALATYQDFGYYWRSFPKLSSETDEAMRPAYRGGFTWLNPRYQGVTLKNVDVYDVNSMYPDKLRNYSLPYGKPFTVYTGAVTPNPIYRLGLQRFRVREAYLKDDCPPFMSSGNTIYGAANYFTEITDDRPPEKRTFMLTLEEFELFKESYDYEGLELLGGFLFKASTNLFKEYVDKFWEYKSSKDPVIKNIGKLYLNSLYGKFGEKYKKPVYDAVYEDRLRFVLTDEETKPKGYLPVAIFVTSYARLHLLNTIKKVGIDKFVYCDTDSVHLVNFVNTGQIETHPTELGKWDHEATFKRVFYIRAKRYCGEMKKRQLKIVAAGIKKGDLYRQIKYLHDFREGVVISTFEFKFGENGMYTRSKCVRI